MERHFRMWVAHNRDDFDDFVLACVYGCVEFSAERFRNVKALHEDNVRRYFADRSDDLLVLDVADAGWQPLCEFLGLPVPDEPYPHRNPALTQPATGPTRATRARVRLRRFAGAARRRVLGRGES